MAELGELTMEMQRIVREEFLKKTHTFYELFELMRRFGIEVTAF